MSDYKQLVSPNLSTTGRVGWCLEYAAKVFGYPKVGRGYEYAWDNWTASKTKHTDQNFPHTVAVPCWFSYTSGGVDEGHVVVRVPGKGFYSSPWKYGTTGAVLDTIADIERIYRCKFVGWTEDVADIKVVAPIAAAPAPAPKPAPASAPKPLIYTTVAGDYLTKIAKGFGLTWQTLYAANKQVIGPDPNKLKIGVKLTIPRR